MNDEQATETTDNVLHAETVKQARALIRKASRCLTRTIINADDDVEVEVSKAALLRALADFDSDYPCGGVLWLDDRVFRLDRCWGNDW